MSVQTLVSNEQWSVAFRSSFRVENPLRHERVQGRVDCYYVVGRTDSGLKIFTENGSVLEKHKETLPNVAPSTPLSQEPPHKSADQVGIARPRGRVYTLPELKGLLGQRLNEAWLRGDFIVVQRHENHAVLQSRADTARFGLQILENGKEMLFPGRTIVNLTLNREDAPLFSGNIVTFSEANPLRLISVSKKAEGYTVVDAEF
jgi:hypothetical protein